MEWFFELCGLFGNIALVIGAVMIMSLFLLGYLYFTICLNGEEDEKRLKKWKKALDKTLITGVVFGILGLGMLCTSRLI